MKGFLNDLRTVIRSLTQSPLPNVFLISVLSLGIGGSTAFFSVIDTIILKPFSFPEPERFYTAHLPLPRNEPDPLSWWNQNNAFEELGQFVTGGLTITAAEGSEYVSAAVVSANFFGLLQSAPQIGRSFELIEELPGNQRVTVISHGLWVRKFGRDAGIVGSTVQLDQVAYTVIGITPPRFRFPGRTDVWIPRIAGDHGPSLGEQEEEGDEISGITIYVGRIPRGTSAEQVVAMLNSLLPLVKETYAGLRVVVPKSVSITPILEGVTRRTKVVLWVLFGAVLFVLLIACANVANLLLIRGHGRQKNLAIRRCLGATHWQIIRLMLTESMMLALLGGIGGAALAMWLVGMIRTFGLFEIPRLAMVGMDFRTLIFSSGISLLTGLFVGFAPAFQANQGNVSEMLKEIDALPSRGRLGSASAFFVVAQVALGIVLLVGAGLTLRSFVRLLAVPSGMNLQNVITARVSLPRTRYDADAELADFQERVLEHLRTVPGVKAAGSVSRLPLGGRGPIALSLKIGEKYTGFVQIYYVSGDYFQVFGIPVLRGRVFADTDIENSGDVIIIARSLWQRYWGEADPVGDFLIVEGEDSPRRVVGVVGDVRHSSLGGDELRQFYLPYRQPYRNGHLNPSMTYAVRTAGPRADAKDRVREEIYKVNPVLPLYKIRTMEEVLAESVASDRIRSQLLGSFAGTGLFLAAIGIFGVLSYSVSRRTHEIGVRMALGAQSGDILRMIIRQGMALVGVGLVIGLLASYWLTRYMESFLFGVTPTDPATFAGVALLLTAVALLACYLPARRATRVDPMTALRYE